MLTAIAWIICVVLSVGVQSQQIWASEFEVGYQKVLQCDAASSELNLTINTNVQSANFQQSWPPVERREGSSWIGLQYFHSPPASRNISSKLSLFDIQCLDILNNSSPKFVFDFDLSPSQEYVNQQFTVDQIVDQESVFSGAVIDSRGSVLACCSLIPEFPTFPAEFSVTIEANMGDKGYSIYQKEYYSSIKNLLRVDTYTAAGNKITIQDYNNQNQDILLLANASYPSGLCQSQKIDQSTQLNTLTLLFLEDDIGARAKFVPLQDPPIIRGVPCEQWTYQLEGNGNNTMGINGNYSVDVYFAFSSWQVARSHEHRQLMRIRVAGVNYQSGQSVEHYYEYVDFVPSVGEDIQFEACKIIPSGRDCGCSLEEIQSIRLKPSQLDPPEERMTVAGVACLFPFIYKEVVHSDCVKIGQREVCPDEKGVWQECILLQPDQNQSLQVTVIPSPSTTPPPSSQHQPFSSSQSVDYVICGIIGLIVGVVITGMATYLVIQKRKPVLPNYQLYKDNETELTNRDGASKN